MVIPILIFLGLMFGSFINALVWRLHEQAEYLDDEDKRKKLSKADKERLEQLSVVKGRSMCAHCGHTLSALDLVPVLSWVFLRGRCRYCRRPIEDTPLAELLLPAVFVLSYLFWPFGAVFETGLSIGMFSIWLLIAVCLVALLIYDARWFILPDRIVWPVTGLSLILVVLLAVQTGDVSYAFWAIGGALTISGIFWLLSILSNGAWIGWGDVKLGLALGLIVGSPLMAALVIFVASLTGSLLSMPQILRGKNTMSSQLPFGPHLIVATLVVFLWGNNLWDWYFSLLNT